MRFAVLGAGGVGGFVGAVLAHAGDDVTLLVRPEALAAHPPELRIESAFGNLRAAVGVAARLDREVDVLWVTVKATQLEAALAAVPDPSRAGTVVPLLNGVDHVGRLRAFFGDSRVVPATIAGEMEKVAPGLVAHRSPFARLSFATSGESALAEPARKLSEYGCACRFVADEVTLLWRKLVMLAPFALNTTALAGPIGEVRDAPAWNARLKGAAREACAVATALGATVDTGEVLEALRTFPPDMRSSMQKDVAAGRPPELDAIAGPVLRGARAHGVAVPITAELTALVEARRTDTVTGGVR